MEYRTIENQKIEPDADFKSFVFKTGDSPYISPEEIDKARAELAPQYFRQEYEASFENYTGIIYKEFDTARHVMDMPLGFVKSWWNVYVGIDTGRHTAVSFIAIDDNGRAFVFDEIYDYDGLVNNIAVQIKHKLAEWGRKTAVFVIDSASQVKREYEYNGVPVLDAQKDVENQIAQIRGLFQADKLFFNRARCPMHIVEHKGYVWNERAKKPEPVKENDHSCNSVQYPVSMYLGKSVDGEKISKYQRTIEYHNFYPNEGKEIQQVS